MFRRMKANGAGQVQVEEKSTLFIKTNFQKKIECMEKVSRSATLVDKVMELQKHPTVKKNYIKENGGEKSVLIVFMGLGKKAEDNEPYVEDSGIFSQFSVVHNGMSSDPVDTIKKSSQEERAASRSGSHIAQKMWDLILTHPNSQYRNKVTSEMESIFKMENSVKTKKRDELEKTINDATAVDATPNNFPSLSWMDDYEDLKCDGQHIKPGDCVWTPVKAIIPNDPSRNLPQEYQGMAPPTGIKHNNKKTDVELLMENSNNQTQLLVDTIRGTCNKAKYIKLLRKHKDGEYVQSLSNSDISKCVKGKDVYQLAAEKEQDLDIGVFLFTPLERKEIVNDKTRDLKFHLHDLTYPRRDFLHLQ